MKISRTFKTSNQHNSSRPNLWGTIEGIVNYSIKKKRLHATVIAAVVIIISLRISPEELARLVNRIFSWVENVYYIGWLLFLICAIGWYSTFKKLKKRIAGK